jgi:hypothetical protein
LSRRFERVIEPSLDNHRFWDKKGRKKGAFLGFGVKKIKIVTLWHSVALYGTSRKLDYVIFIDYL